MNFELTDGPGASRTPAPPPPPPFHEPIVIRPNWPLHIALFLATAASTTLSMGPLYGAAIMGILLAHEMGHYVTARRLGVPATLPYFIPLPFISLFGTLGAVIRMATQNANRRMLFDIGVAGPIAGMVLTVPVCLVGLAMSRVVEVPAGTAGNLTLGSSIMFQWFADMMVGKLGPGQDVELHPLAFAGWAGMFLTSLNLIPAGQLDGGHVSYAIFGRRVHFGLSLAMVLGFVALAIFVTPSWWAIGIMVALFGLKHPPTGDEHLPIDRKRLILGLALLVLFVLTFTLRPLE